MGLFYCLFSDRQNFRPNNSWEISSSMFGWTRFTPLYQISKLAENPSKSGKHLKPKAIPSFLGDIGLIKVVLNFLFRHPKCHFLGALLPKVPIFTCPTRLPVLGLRPRTGSLVFSDHISIRMMVYANLHPLIWGHGRQLDDRHRNPNTNIRKIIWLGNQLPITRK